MKTSGFFNTCNQNKCFPSTYSMVYNLFHDIQLISWYTTYMSWYTTYMPWYTTYSMVCNLFHYIQLICHGIQLIPWYTIYSMVYNLLHGIQLICHGIQVILLYTNVFNIHIHLISTKMSSLLYTTKKTLFLRIMDHLIQN